MSRVTPNSENPCNNFFSILADFGDLSEKLKSHVHLQIE
jgi:hypothetical protein